MASRLIWQDIISLARLLGCPVLTQAGKKAGRVADVAAAGCTAVMPTLRSPGSWSGQAAAAPSSTPRR